MQHEPVLCKEVLHFLDCKPGGNYVDANVGAGGHSRLILEANAPRGVVVGFEWDQETAKIAIERLRKYGGRFRIIEDNFSGIGKALIRGDGSFDGILYDLGVSSIQIESSKRGFSFLREGPLDMRMDARRNLLAGNIVNEYDEENIASILWKYGEERFSRRIARSIVKGRSKNLIRTTLELSEIIKSSIPRKFWRKGLHPATKSFMALRIAVNEELSNLETTLKESLKILKKGSRIVVISFHSLEDRIVKNFFREESAKCRCPKDLPKCICSGKARLKILTKRPVTPDEEEMKSNPRSTSAKLRAAEVL